MFKGGIADKLGNRYEAKWLVYTLLSMVLGDFENLKFEGIDTKFIGFEFSVSNEFKTEWHQTKINAPNGNWTIRALEQEKLLSAFRDRLEASQVDECHFVSQDNSKIMRDLTEEARMCNSVEEFQNAISEDKSEKFETLTKIWACKKSTSFDYLRRTFITIQPDRELSKHITWRGNHLFQTDLEIFPILRDFMELNLNTVVTRQLVRRWIGQQKGIQFKAWANPNSIRECIDSATNKYLGTYTPFGLGGKTLIRSQAQQTLEQINSPQGAGIIILTGVAGSGKSGVIREIIKELIDQETTVLAFRIDHFLDKRTSQEIGQSLLNRQESPISTLKGLSPNTTSVLIIDQLDAVSEVSGRDGLAKSAIFELLNEAKAYGGVRVIVACRSYDLANDDRFRSLSDGSNKKFRTKKIDIPSLDWDCEISPLLDDIGLQPTSITEAQKRLLAVPVNLAVFIEIGEKNLDFRNRTHLFDKLLVKKQRVLDKKNRGWSIIQSLSAASKWMSERQKLSAPISVMDRYAGAIDWLASENFIIISGGHLNFFHESFFDYVYARSFINGDETALDLIQSSEQHLFRRTQIRQIFTLMRDADVDKFLSQLKALLESKNTRFHLKISIAQWLGAIEYPSSEELRVITGLFEENEKPDSLERAVFFQTPNWFPLLNDHGFLFKFLGSGDEVRVSVVLNWLSHIAGDFPLEISKILRKWWNGEEEHAEQLVDWFGFLRRKKPDDDLLSLCEDVIRSKPTNLFKEDGRDRILMLLHSWVEHDPDKCGGMVRELFEAWFETHPEASLLDRDDFKLLDGHSLRDLAKKSPKAFVEGTTDAIVRTIVEAVAEGAVGKNWYRLNNSLRSKYTNGFDGLVQLYETSLKELAEYDVEFVETVLDKINPELHSRFLALHLHVISANPLRFGSRIQPALKNKNLLEAGADGDTWLLFARSAHSVLKVYPNYALDIENAVLEINQEIRSAKRMLNLINSKEANDWVTPARVLSCLRTSGKKQWNVFRIIGEPNLSSKGRHKFKELSRKFGKNDIEVENNLENYQVLSPISSDECELMSDANWLKAFQKHSANEDRMWQTGGARELSSVLFEKVKQSPERYANLFFEMPLDTNSHYFSEILRGLRESEEIEKKLLVSVLIYANLNFKETLSEQILYIVETRTYLILEPVIKKMVFDYAVSGAFQTVDEQELVDESSDKKVLSIDDLINSVGQIVVRSTYGGRLKAWETIKSCLWAQKEIAEDVWELIESRAFEEQSISIRCGIFDAMTPLFNDNRSRYSATLRVLTQDGYKNTPEHPPIAILATHSGVRMQKYIDYNFPEFAGEMINELLSTDREMLRLVGFWWLCCEKFRHDRSNIELQPLGKQTKQEKVLLADVAAGAYLWTDIRSFAEETLLALFQDNDAKIQKAAAGVFRHCKNDDFYEYLPLAKKFVETPAFLSKPTHLLYALEKANCDVLDISIRAADRLLKSIVEKGDQFGGRGSGLYKLQKLLAREYSSSERVIVARAKILDLIDYMLEHEISGVDKIIEATDR
jgi:hypothetical protein